MSKRILVAYLNVGTLPVKKAKKFTKKTGRRIRKKLPNKYNLLVIPMRDSPTRVEVI